ncbi:Alpha/Beta hydrolase protein [Stachybotrys elegans]|uniref:Alpha/Beta hydrolase protein n=1 Tax=Stachybotrys elegans TaxID=80388 RepID=A0A8K0SQF3_9HYPO|nr:Alpha/Beta hydrolase protein [Stachybotrys elegans]
MYCQDCFKGTIHDGTPRGKQEVVHGIPTYVASPEGNPVPSAVIIFISDIFGTKLINNKLLADKYATDTGCLVFVPDIIPGGGASLALIDAMDIMNTSVLWYDIPGQIRRVLAGLQAVSIMGPMLVRTRNAVPQLLEYSRAAKSALPEGGRLGVAGFCWGGYQSIKLSQEPMTPGSKTPLVDAHFVAHPSGANVPNDLITSVKALAVPTSLAIGDRDLMLPVKSIAPLEEAMAEAFGGNKDLYQVAVYEGCTHGFAVRADPKQAIEDKGAIAAAEQAKRWFRKHLGVD